MDYTVLIFLLRLAADYEVFEVLMLTSLKAAKGKKNSNIFSF